MKTIFLSLALTLVLGSLLPAAAQAQTTPDPAMTTPQTAASTDGTVTTDDTAAPAQAADWIATLSTDTSCQTASTPALESTQQLEPSGCFGPNPPFTCKCGSCCSYCKCWQGYYLALCDFE